MRKDGIRHPGRAQSLSSPSPSGGEWLRAPRVQRVTPFAAGAAHGAICSLPLLSVPPTKVLGIGAGWMTVPESDGELGLFTYGCRCPISSASV